MAGEITMLYAQVGTGKSSICAPPSDPAANPNDCELTGFEYLLELDYYREEVEALVGHLGLAAYHLLGHSWGSIVATLHAASSPPGLASVALAGGPPPAHPRRPGQLPGLHRRPVGPRGGQPGHPAHRHAGDHPRPRGAGRLHQRGVPRPGGRPHRPLHRAHLPRPHLRGRLQRRVQPEDLRDHAGEGGGRRCRGRASSP